MISKEMATALNEQMNFETYSAYIYKAMSAYASFLGLDGVANWFEIQYQEEIMHSDKFYAYILDQSEQVTLAAMPEPKKDYKDVQEMFEDALKHEKEVTARIYKLVDLALDERDHGTNAFLQWFVTEQVEEEAAVNAILDKLKLVENHPNGIFMINNELGQRTLAPSTTA